MIIIRFEELVYPLLSKDENHKDYSKANRKMITRMYYN